MERYICIHAHFYQPPRENPWLEAIELQDSAYPYHDWNERVTAECYGPNTASRILDAEGRIDELINNYARISFNFGPTLLSWMENEAPEFYQAILDADQESRERFSGHGSAMAQAYNHMILPLANRRDKETQVRWGISDFEHRFKRRPEGMWLPETAVDIETLEVLAAEGIRFTVLAPHQASRTRKLGGEEWEDVSGQKIDPTRAYTIRLPSGKNLAIFFYDGPISRAVAFEHLLDRGETFAQRLIAGFSDRRPWPQLLHIATDGETYGHHHRFGDMALAYALHYIESNRLARLTNYGEYLEKHPPTHEVGIFENTSWSCAHGVERWRSNCLCSSGMQPGWNQEWRKPLREALDRLRDSMEETWSVKAREYLKTPWEARDRYIDVVLDPTPDRVKRFIEEHARTAPNDANRRTTILRLLEYQRQAMLMYTSCGWFFDDLSGIETIQIIQYAARALQLAKVTFGRDLEPRFLADLEKARSNVPGEGTGRDIYRRYVETARVNLMKVCAHYAMTSLFEEYEDTASIYCYTAERLEYKVSEAGKAKLCLGRARFTFRVTEIASDLCFGVLHFGDHNITCGVGPFQREESYNAFSDQIFKVFDRADFTETIRLLDRHFGTATYSLKSLFRDEQRKIMDTILAATLEDAENSYRQLYDNHAPLMRFLQDSGVPLPKALYVAAEYIFNITLRRAFQEEILDPDYILPLLEEARTKGIPLDTDTLEYALRKSIENVALRLRETPMDEESLLKLEQALRLQRSLPFSINLRTVQNLYYKILGSAYKELRRKADEGDENAGKWVSRFTGIGEALSVRVP